MMVKSKDSFSRGISKCTQSVQSIAIINGVSTLIEKAQYTGICTEEDIRSVISDAFVSKRLDAPDKQPVSKPYKKEEHDGYVFC
jgi:hypothetical protein